MTKIYLIRHAEAEGNYYRRIQGHHNGDITRRGYLQIEALAERFRDIKIDAVYASDLQRTQKTAGAILKYHDLKLNIEPRLKEVGMGIWEDEPWGNVAHYDPTQLFLFGSDPASWHVEGSERFEDLKARITGIISELAEHHKGQTIACVSHGMAIRSFISVILGIPSDRISEILHGDNTCVALINIQNGKMELEYYNDNSHLKNGLSTFANQSWWKDNESLDLSNLRFEPMNMKKDSDLYNTCYKEGWEQAHGTLQGYSPAPYQKAATTVSRKDPMTLMKAYRGDDFAGIIELDPNRMADVGAGWLSLVYIVPELRGRGYAVQLIGHAVSYYRSLGRGSLRLHVAETNTRALTLYDRLGFSCLSVTEGNVVPLRMLEKKL